MTLDPSLNLAITIGIVVLLGCMSLSTYRLLKGPTIFDRVLSLDGVAISIVSIIALLSIKWGSEYYLDLILVFSIFGFFGTVAFAAYLKKTLPTTYDAFQESAQEEQSHPDKSTTKPTTRSKAKGDIK